ncbi:hypothetical protein CBS147332_5266 [Penicillium roqueforti]|nr:hypothetical protein LCP963914a_2293 [Penicillium roqueforti]KAI2713526.1 hypothetical protein CBS147332_5266 [Penicillium roqueforti]KAI2716621.1 hypothetical protein CBS147354_6889 [Penicillium roqueforti]KAI3119138.1 hypothetical protein CBS147331_2550 [Penicillium roqueforti]KAI3140822.1 hypothetical protein CBS147326_2523 [Penicillium roqueforti]
MEIRHKPANTINNSTDRCHQSTELMLYRPVSKRNQSADQLHRVARVEDTTQQVGARDGQTQEQTPPQSRFYSRAFNSQSTNSSPNPKTTSRSTKVKSIKSASVTGPSLSLEEQIGGFYKATILVRSTVKQARQLRDDKRALLGEIELEWINSTITGAETAANDLAASVKRFKQSSPQNRCSWKRRDYEVTLEKESRVLLAHDKVKTVLSHLGSLQLTLGKDELFFSPSEVSMVASAILELPSETTVLSEFELLPVKPERPIPKIVVTQYDDDNEYSHSYQSSPPSYEASGMNAMAEFR